MECCQRNEILTLQLVEVEMFYSDRFAQDTVCLLSSVRLLVGRLCVYKIKLWFYDIFSNLSFFLICSVKRFETAKTEF